MPRNLRWLSSAATLFCGVVLTALLSCSITRVTADTVTLASRIDALVAKGNVVPVADNVDDLAFLRRIYRDLLFRLQYSPVCMLYCSRR